MSRSARALCSSFVTHPRIHRSYVSIVLLSTSMAFLFRVDEYLRVLTASCRGVVTDQDLVELLSALEPICLAHHPRSIVFDWSKVTEVRISSSTINRLADTPSKIPTHLPRIHIAPSDLLYGYARMFQAVAEPARPKVYVVRTHKEASQLLQRSLLFRQTAFTDGLLS
jgi:hypothetical protein